MDLFDIGQDPVNLDIPDAEVLYYPYFLNAYQSDQFFNIIYNQTPWQQDDITLFGKTYKQPRLTALYANNKRTYTYSNITMKPHKFTKELLVIKEKIEKIVPVNFTTCLLNLYRNGEDSNGWHADDEKELGEQPIIASLSLGQSRYFHFKHKKNKNLKRRLLLEHGSLLIMKGETQKYWLHQIPKSKTKNLPRLNLTYRVIC